MTITFSILSANAKIPQTLMLSAGFPDTLFNSPSRTRTYDNAVNSRALYQLSYRGLFPPHGDGAFPRPFKTAHCPSPSKNPQGQALGLLVSVSSVHYCTSTPDLSTSSSPRGLPGLFHGISHLEGGFTLRCLQRLSRPGLATRLCTWRYNRYTSGRSTPVLSYWGQLLSNILRPRRIGTELSHDVLNPARVPL